MKDYFKEFYGMEVMIPSVELRCRKRFLQNLLEKLNSTILKQNAQLRKDGYTDRF